MEIITLPNLELSTTLKFDNIPSKVAFANNAVGLNVAPVWPSPIHTWDPLNAVYAGSPCNLNDAVSDVLKSAYVEAAPVPVTLFTYTFGFVPENLFSAGTDDST